MPRCVEHREHTIMLTATAFLPVQCHRDLYAVMSRHAAGCIVIEPQRVRLIGVVSSLKNFAADAL